MATKLAVTVAVDLDAAAVTIRPAGSLTSENVQCLLAVVHRAERTLPGFAIRLDGSDLHVGSPEALSVLEGSLGVAVPQPVRDAPRRSSGRAMETAA
jgi:hypothetical protein